MARDDAVPVVLCEVFRSPRREGMYLYVARNEGLERVPEDLLQRFGTPESALVFRLDAQRRLARARAADVLAALEDPGFYLQLPPVPGATEATANDLRAAPPEAGDGQVVINDGPPEDGALSEGAKTPC